MGTLRYASKTKTLIVKLAERIDLLVKLGKRLEEGIPDNVLRSTEAHNPWFSHDNVIAAVNNVRKHFLDRSLLEAWAEKYKIKESTSKKIGIVMAGNIPLVGFHDFLCCFISGHISQVKLSDRDAVLFTYLVSIMSDIDSGIENYINIIERLESYDAVIATGSDTTSKYFEKYFGAVPHIIRKNRSGVGVISKQSTIESLSPIGNDLFNYFGLGCRNISKLYMEEGVELDTFYKSLTSFKEVINHNKYKNNYDYTYALYLMNKEEFYTDDVLIMRPNKDIASRIATVHYEYYTDPIKLAEELRLHQDEIQCVVSDIELPGIKVFPFGEAQIPSLNDYADGIDTMAFLQASN